MWTPFQGWWLQRKQSAGCILKSSPENSPGCSSFIYPETGRVWKRNFIDGIIECLRLERTLKITQFQSLCPGQGLPPTRSGCLEPQLALGTSSNEVPIALEWHKATAHCGSPRAILPLTQLSALLPQASSILPPAAAKPFLCQCFSLAFEIRMIGGSSHVRV